MYKKNKFYTRACKTFISSCKCDWWI